MNNELHQVLLGRFDRFDRRHESLQEQVGQMSEEIAGISATLQYIGDCSKEQGALATRCEVHENLIEKLQLQINTLEHEQEEEKQAQQATRRQVIIAVITTLISCGAAIVIAVIK